MNHVIGVSNRSTKLKVRTVLAFKRNRIVVSESSPALLAVGR